MPLYTVLVTVKISADDPREAYTFIRHAIDNAKKADIEHMDSEVVETEPDADDEPPAKLTRTERLQGLADRGCDTWSEYRYER